MCAILKAIITEECDKYEGTLCPQLGIYVVCLKPMLKVQILSMWLRNELGEMLHR